MVDADLHGVGDLAELKRSTLVRVVGALVSLAMSRRVVTPLLLGSDPATAQLAALDEVGDHLLFDLGQVVHFNM